MATGDTRGNRYDETFTITQDERSGTFGSLECAIRRSRPRCVHLQCTILGHEAESRGTYYRRAH
jgi:hypothetical protein